MESHYSYLMAGLYEPYYTVNRDIKIFSDSIACAKIKNTKYVCNINDNAVQGRLSEN